MKFSKYIEQMQQANPMALSPTDKTTIQTKVETFVREMRKSYPSNVNFQNAMAYAMSMISRNSPDRAANLKMQTILSQPAAGADTRQPASPIQSPIMGQ